MRFSRSFCLLLTEFFLSIRREIPVRSLPLCQILQIFTVNFQRYLRSKYKFCKIFESTRSLNLHLREPGVLARTRAISGPGRTRQETISSHLKWPGNASPTTLDRKRQEKTVCVCVCVCVAEPQSHPPMKNPSYEVCDFTMIISVLTVHAFQKMVQISATWSPIRV